jgi:hypothetical protein
MKVTQGRSKTPRHSRSELRRYRFTTPSHFSIRSNAKICDV